MACEPKVGLSIKLQGTIATVAGSSFENNITASLNSEIKTTISFVELLFFSRYKSHAVSYPKFTAKFQVKTRIRQISPEEIIIKLIKSRAFSLIGRIKNNTQGSNAHL